MALLAIVLCVNFTACEDLDGLWGTDDIGGATYDGTHPDGYGIELYVKSETKCVIIEYQLDSGIAYYREECDYQYDKATNVFTCIYKGRQMTAQVKEVGGNEIMEFTDETGTYILTFAEEVFDRPFDPMLFLYGTVWSAEDGEVRKEIHIIDSYRWELRLYAINDDGSLVQMDTYLCDCMPYEDGIKLYIDYIGWIVKIEGDTMTLTNEEDNSTQIFTRVQE